jgi:hypothetical protein
VRAVHTSGLQSFAFPATESKRRRAAHPTFPSLRTPSGGHNCLLVGTGQAPPWTASTVPWSCAGEYLKHRRDRDCEKGAVEAETGGAAAEARARTMGSGGDERQRDEPLERRSRPGKAGCAGKTGGCTLRMCVEMAWPGALAGSTSRLGHDSMVVNGNKQRFPMKQRSGVPVRFHSSPGTLQDETMDAGLRHGKPSSNERRHSDDRRHCDDCQLDCCVLTRRCPRD